LKTRTSAFAGAAAVVELAVLVGLAVVLVEVVDVLPFPSSPDPRELKATSRKTTPRKISTMTMARMGSPEDSR
jgi:hypothetical protein